MLDHQLTDCPVIATETDPTEWVQAADVLAGQHRSRRRARRWAATARHRYPGCTVAVSRAASGRWIVLALPGTTVTVHTDSRGVGLSTSELGRIAYRVWLLRHLHQQHGRVES